MEREELVPALQCCTTYNLEYSFINWLSEHELIELHRIEQQVFIPHSQLKDLEQYVTLHHDLDINLEGIEAISHLLKRIGSMQQELDQLRNRLRMFETNEHFFDVE